MLQNTKELELQGKRVIIIGTAHISKDSVDEVVSVIESQKPDMVCVELDAERWNAMNSQNSWEKTDIVKILKEGRAFLLIANLVLSSFQRRMGLDSGLKPGAEMAAAINTAISSGIDYSFCDRSVQTTLRRAWGKSNFWNKAKLITQLIAAAFSTEKPSTEEIERLKKHNELDEMMNELAEYLPSVKAVLIDERDKYLAAKIWAAKGNTVVAVIGAGHAAGVEAWLKRFSEGEDTDISELETIPNKTFSSKIIGLIIPLIIVSLIVAGFFNTGLEYSLSMLLNWVLFNSTFAALGALLCLAHPLTILVSFITAPIATLNPFIAVGLFSGITEAWLRKPQVADFQNLVTDAGSLKGFYKNKVTHILLVFMLTSIGGAIGNFTAIPKLFSSIF